MKLEEIAITPGIDSDGNVIALHGTTVLNAKSIREIGFKPSDPAAVAAMVEKEYGLSKDSVLKSHWYQFPMRRSDLDYVHFTGDAWTATQYTVPEQLQDALHAAYREMHPEIADMNFKEVEPTMNAWVKTEARRLTKPEVLVVKMPWKVVGDNAFGRTLSLDEYKKLAGDKLPHSFSIPISELKDVHIVGSYYPSEYKVENTNLIDEQGNK